MAVANRGLRSLHSHTAEELNPQRTIHPSKLHSAFSTMLISGFAYGCTVRYTFSPPTCTLHSVEASENMDVVLSTSIQTTSQSRPPPPPPAGLEKRRSKRHKIRWSPSRNVQSVSPDTGWAPRRWTRCCTVTSFFIIFRLCSFFILQEASGSRRWSRCGFWTVYSNDGF